MNRVLLPIIVAATLSGSIASFAQTNVLTMDEATRQILSNVVAKLVDLKTATNVFPVKLDEETNKLLRTATEDKKDAFGSALLGGFLTLLGGMAVGFWSHCLQTRHKKNEDIEFADNVLRAI